IPMMEEKPEPPPVVRESTLGAGQKSAAVAIPANSKVRMLLDQTYLTTGYPELRFSKGRGAKIQLGYAEALYLKGQRGKGNRNEVEGKDFIGNHDVVIADGGDHRVFRPLWWRTWRYMELTVETKDEPLSIEDLRGIYTGYPFERKARFDAGVKEIDRILDTGWRTARLCAHETYQDCPYYEQLQYAGDTRIQSMVSMYMTGDGRLARNAIDLLNTSRTSEGATMSRAPTRLHQYIPGFSLWWIGMVHDYWMYQDDPKFVKEMLPGVHAVLSFFAARQQANGSIGVMPWWNYVDWTKEWRGGAPGGDAEGSKAPADLQLLLAYQWAARLEDAMGSKALAAEYREAARLLSTTIQKLYWDDGRKMYADGVTKSGYSQHTNALAVLAGLTQGKAARDLAERVAADTSLVQCSIYFRYYLHQALAQSGGGDGYLDQLGQWRTMLSYGLTTWAEVLDPTRSDCHAWGASPNIEVFRTVLGIDSAAPGFQRVLIRPSLGKLTKVSGAIPHPKGEVAVSLALEGGKLKADVKLPSGVSGEFVWKGKTRKLDAGVSRFVIE
ncbi:MAG TPA: alpha-L-rhamnosidase C-terminal domain-containing protein, partial [Armatimonadota bacterium]